MRIELIASAFFALIPGSCTVVRVETDDSPPRVEANGLIDGHLALGVSDERKLLDLDLFDGSSSGAIAELTVWKLLRVELGLAGASIGVGPLHFGLGILAYDPKVPRMIESGRAPASTPATPETEVPPSEVMDAGTGG